MNRYFKFIALFLITSVFSFGCCWRYSLSGISIPEDVKTITIGFFKNEAPLVSPTYSQKFTEKLRSKFLNETRLSVVPEYGDFKMTGTIRDYKVEPVQVQGNTSSAQNRFTVAVNVTFSCPKHPEMDYEESFTFFTDFDSKKSFQSIESQLQDEVSEILVQKIFNRSVLNSW